METHLSNDKELLKIRHSCEHVLTQAMEKLFPGIKKAMGPATNDGFYFDFDLPEGIKITEGDFPKIEAEMQQIIDEKLDFIQEEISYDTAKELFENNPYKLEWLRELEQRNLKPTIYKTGDQPGAFLDLCAGPHVSNTREIRAFKLLSIAGAYWRGDSRNKMLVRIYGTAFESAEALERHLYCLEEAKKRDHRKLGKELELFAFSPDSVGQGLPLWLPKGTVIRDQLEYWARGVENQHGYHRVVTPIIGKESLYECSGHLAYFKEDMYAPIDIDGEKYFLRPMNCPHHHVVYKQYHFSYRDLPFRIAEYGNVFRYEPSGALSGLMRTRGFCQNDAHIYCREDQVVSEFKNVLKMHMSYYDILGVSDYYIRLSMPDLSKEDKYINNPDEWKKALDMIRTSLKEVNFPYVEVEGEAAFYGPKVDIQIKSAIGTEYTISTSQLDFMASERFGLSYIGEDGDSYPIYVIHRAPLGSHERMVAYLIEHYAGAFPVWLAPIQMRVIPISDKHLDYAHTIFKQFLETGIRAELDDRHQTMSYKVRRCQSHKIPYAIIVGDEEIKDQVISIRDRLGNQKRGIKLQEFQAQVLELIKTKSLEL